jgi:hypothetical protein
MKNLAQGINDFSTTLNPLATTTISSVLNPPTNIVFSASSTTSLTISWSAPAATSSNLPVSRYIIERSFDNYQTSTTTFSATDDTNTFITIENLNPNLVYKFKIRAQNDVLVNGKPTVSLFSNTSTVSTKWLLESPKNFTLVSNVDLTNTVSLKWDALVFTSSDVAEQLDGYEIQWSGQRSYYNSNVPTYVISNSKKVSSNTTTIEVTELYPEINYTFKVRAFNKSGVTTSFSNTVVSKIVEQIINPLTNFNVELSGINKNSKEIIQAVVKFDPPVTNYNINGYEVYWYDSNIIWNEFSKYSLKYAFFENSNSNDYNTLKKIIIDDFIDYYTEIKPRSYTFRIRAVHYIPGSNNYYYLYFPDGFTGLVSLRAYGGSGDYAASNTSLYREIINSQVLTTTMPSVILPLNTNPPRVNGVGVEVTSFTSATVKWRPPETYQPFNEYYVSVSRDNTFPNGQSGTSEVTLSNSTTSTEWVGLEGNVTYYFRIGIKNIYDNVIYYETVAQVTTLTLYRPDNFSINPPASDPVLSQLIHHDRKVDETDNCFKVTMVSSTSYDVEILRPIELFHDISIPGNWGGNIKITIDNNWNINMSFNTPNGWRNNNQWIYGRLAFQSGNLQEESDGDGSGQEYTRNLYYNNDTTYSNRYNKNIRRDFQVKSFRQGSRPRNFSASISGAVTGSDPSFVGTMTRRFTGNNPPGPDERYFLNNPDDNSIYVLRYQVFLQGYYAGTARKDLMVVLSGNLKVTLPGYKKIDTGYVYGYSKCQAGLGDCWLDFC